MGYPRGAPLRDGCRGANQSGSDVGVDESRERVEIFQEMARTAVAHSALPSVVPIDRLENQGLNRAILSVEASSRAASGCQVLDAVVSGVPKVIQRSRRAHSMSAPPATQEVRRGQKGLRASSVAQSRTSKSQPG